MNHLRATRDNATPQNAQKTPKLCCPRPRAYPEFVSQEKLRTKTIGSCSTAVRPTKLLYFLGDQQDEQRNTRISPKCQLTRPTEHSCYTANRTRKRYEPKRDPARPKRPGRSPHTSHTQGTPTNRFIFLKEMTPGANRPIWNYSTRQRQKFVYITADQQSRIRRPQELARRATLPANKSTLIQNYHVATTQHRARAPPPNEPKRPNPKNKKRLDPETQTKNNKSDTGRKQRGRGFRAPWPVGPRPTVLRRGRVWQFETVSRELARHTIIQRNPSTQEGGHAY